MSASAETKQAASILAEASQAQLRGRTKIEMRHTFATLDAMRGAAALMVVIWHAGALFGWRPASGYLAVDLFFILSGFVLAHAYDAKFASGMGVLDFMRVRIIRLYPLYVLGMVVMLAGLLAAVIMGAPGAWAPARIALAAATAAAFLPTPGGESLYPLNPPAWSLGLELLVNILFVATWGALRSVRAMVILLGVAGGVLVGAALYFGSLNVGHQWAGAWGGIPRILYGFFLGVLILRLRRERKILLRLGALPPVVVMVALLTLAPDGGLRPAYDMVCTLVLFPLIVLAGSSSEPAHRLRDFYGFLGRISYAIYVLHVPLLAIVLGMMAKLGWSEHGWGVGLAFLAGLIVSAYLADRLYDDPVRGLVGRLTRRPQTGGQPIERC